METTTIKSCPLNAAKKIKGRSDKKFCSAECRTYFHNKHRGLESNMMRAINYVLQRNRRILMECAAEHARSKVPVYSLQARGFDFSFYTHCRADRKGNEVIFCYDYGYQRLNESKVLICAKSC
jgi:hypothetical protein